MLLDDLYGVKFSVCCGVSCKIHLIVFTFAQFVTDPELAQFERFILSTSCIKYLCLVMTVHALCHNILRSWLLHCLILHHHPGLSLILISRLQTTGLCLASLCYHLWEPRLPTASFRACLLSL